VKGGLEGETGGFQCLEGTKLRASNVGSKVFQADGS